MINTTDLQALNKKGFFRVADAAFNVGRAWKYSNASLQADYAGFLQSITPDIVENVLTYRTGEQALGGVRTFLSFEQNEVGVPFLQKTGRAQAYNDFNMPSASGAAVQFNMYAHYRFSASLMLGSLQEAQLAAANIDAKNAFLRAATEALKVELNNVAFYGKESASVAGLLTHEGLSNYQGATKLFANSTWEELLKFFADAVKTLTNQSGNNINAQSQIRVVIASDAYATLQGKFTALGISVLDALKKAYPYMEFVSAVELNSANNQQNVVYFIGESDAGGVDWTCKLGLSEFGRLSPVTQNLDYITQKISAGTIGAVIAKPDFIVRYTNI